MTHKYLTRKILAAILCCTAVMLPHPALATEVEERVCQTGETLLAPGTLTLDQAPQEDVESSVGEAVGESAVVFDSIASNSMTCEDSNQTSPEIIDGLPAHENDSVLVNMRQGATLSEVENIASRAGGLDWSGVQAEDLSAGTVRLGITDGSTVTDVIARIHGIDSEVSAQPNYLYRVSSNMTAVNDAEDGKEENQEPEPFTSVDDEYALSQWGLDRGDVYYAWDQVKVNGSVGVAVIDTGVQLDHPDLADNIVASHHTLSSTYTIGDQVGHGTHVAGIIAGVANNAIGVAGTSYNAHLVIIKASTFKGNEFDTMALVRAYEWLESLDESGKTVAQHYNVRVVNLSIGGLDETRSSNLPDDALHRAMLKARDEYGMLTVAAAGNANKAEDLPYAEYPGDSYACLSVMNLDEVLDEHDDVVGVGLHESSNYNLPGESSKDVCAPGTDIYSTWLNDEYTIDTGTSMAAPFVAGVAALVFAANPYLTPTQVQSIIEASATDLGEPGWDERYGYGMVNAAAAVRMANVARMEGCKVVGVYGTTKLKGKLGPGQGSAVGNWKWDVYDDTGSARFTRAGELLGDTKGDVIVRGTCTTSTGAEISVIDKIAVLDPEVLGDDVVRAGSSSTYACDDSRWTWVWKVENGTGEASIDWTGKLTAIKAGTVEVTATCSSNTDIVVRKQVTIAAAAAAAPMRAASYAPVLTLLPPGSLTLDDAIAA